ncbi:amidohydrolase [Photorhabdus laumondii subsp. laumondii]|nr:MULTISPECIES: creatininase family protein [Photorhabdus]AWK43519.1 amidohydrolase [Photorhabdus laumondii subsp. laumondii]AXG44198.1 amidohydrolase [Photorhabdus laumondii subsp. laumondii]AXG48826.1 amidohydrolase [Photorhabdus laumondii subsp. laumondii]KTL60300.1 amidohydrolase [Photorhabdus laumondii subsp. laumondii]MCC8382707.1 creatininase family protein [Photorhabdus laumondii]
MNNKKIREFAELTSEQVLTAVEGKTLIWPIGGIEQHGPHLPLNVDSVIPEAFARVLAEDINGFTLPVQPVSARSLPQSGGGLEFPGTVYLDGSTFTAYISRTIKSLCSLPFKQLVIINGHFENEGFIFEAVDALRAEGHFNDRSVIVFSWWSLVSDDWTREHLVDFPGWHAEHAGLTETSLMLHLRPDLVRAERPDHDKPPRAGIYQVPIKKEFSTRGVLSKTSGSSAEIGELIFEHVRQQILELVTAD